MSNHQPSDQSISCGIQDTNAERRGPRPLALHIAHAEWAWRSGNSEQLTNFYQGIKAYRQHPYRRNVRQMPIVWEKGSCRLVDYGPADGWPLLVVPSLINRAYILDLMPGASLLEFLRGGSIRPLLLDWGDGSGSKGRPGLNRLIQEHMEPALSWIHHAAGRRPLVLGYCMGGTLTTALACLCHDQVAGLALLAAPWDFGPSNLSNDQAKAGYRSLASGMGCIGGLPVDFQQTLFAQIDPLTVPRKFARFAGAISTSSAAHRFVAIEDWLNDGVSMGAAVAADCLVDWYSNNAPVRSEWRIGDMTIRPERLDLPTFLAIPDSDRIVPPVSALALESILLDPELIRPRAGHVGMIVGQNAKTMLWTPLLKWLRRIAAMQKNLGKTA